MRFVSASPSELPLLVSARWNPSPPCAPDLRGLDASARTLYGVVFAGASPEDRAALLRRFQQSDPPAGEWTITTARQFFRQLRSEVVDAYYQDPPAWPLVGYPGYSMPFGYPDGGPCGAIGEDDR